MIDKLPLEYKLIILVCVIIFFLLLFFSGSSGKTLSMYKPQGDVKEEDEEQLLDINYNDKFLEELSGGYAGAPKMVASDDKVFYIPPEYCDGNYLRNFRVIGINQSKAVEKTVKKGDEEVIEYDGAVVVYGFQTTYREDYGPDYNFNQDPYEYIMKYDTSNSYFETMMKDMIENAENRGHSVLTTEAATETTTEIDFDMNNANITKNSNAVDDSKVKYSSSF